MTGKAQRPQHHSHRTGHDFNPVVAVTTLWRVTSCVIFKQPGFLKFPKSTKHERLTHVCKMLLMAPTRSHRAEAERGFSNAFIQMTEFKTLRSNL
jgi:hypothetical protein